MENTEKRYTLYLKIGEDELSVSGEEASYIREMLEEFKYLYAGKMRTARSAGPAPAPRKTRTAPVVDPGFTEFYKKVRPRKGLDKALLYLYYLHQKGDTRGVRRLPWLLPAQAKGLPRPSPRAWAT